jgi:hypothetical protein
MGGSERAVDELVAGLAGGTLMGGVVQLDGGDGAHGGRLAEHEVQVLAVDAVPVGLVLFAGGDEEDISQVDLGADTLFV